MSDVVANMEALVLAAGFGKRLASVSAGKPKPLIEVGGRPIIDWNLELLARCGFRKVFVNLHYEAEQLKAHLGDGSRWGLEIECLYEPVILGTGGAVKNIETRFSGAQLLTINSDILLGADFPLRDVLAKHLGDARNPLATLVLRPFSVGEGDFTDIGIDCRAGRISRLLSGDLKGCDVVGGYMYVGVAVLARPIFSYMPPVGIFFGLADYTFAKVLDSGGWLSYYIYSGYFNDVGTPERLDKARDDAKNFSN